MPIVNGPEKDFPLRRNGSSPHVEEKKGLIISGEKIQNPAKSGSQTSSPGNSPTKTPGKTASKDRPPSSHTHPTHSGSMTWRGMSGNIARTITAPMPTPFSSKTPRKIPRDQGVASVNLKSTGSFRMTNGLRPSFLVSNTLSACCMSPKEGHSSATLPTVLDTDPERVTTRNRLPPPTTPGSAAPNQSKKRPLPCKPDSVPSTLCGLRQSFIFATITRGCGERAALPLFCLAL